VPIPFALAGWSDEDYREFQKKLPAADPAPDAAPWHWSGFVATVADGMILPASQADYIVECLRHPERRRIIAAFPAAFSVLAAEGERQAFELLERYRRADSTQALLALSNIAVPEILNHVTAKPSLASRKTEFFSRVLDIGGPEWVNWIMQILPDALALFHDEAGFEDIVGFLSDVRDDARRFNQLSTVQDKVWAYNAIADLIKSSVPLRLAPKDVLSLIRATYPRAGMYANRALYGFHNMIREWRPLFGDESFSVVMSLPRLFSRHNAAMLCEFFEGNRPYFASLGSDRLKGVFALFAEVCELYPRSGASIIQGVVEGLKTGILEPDLTRPFEDGSGRDVREAIMDFVRVTHGFIPPLFATYRQRGDAVLREITAPVASIFAETFSWDAADAFAEHHGEYALLGLVHKVSPPTGRSGKSYEHQLGVLRNFRARGDLRDQVPPEWRGRLETFTIGRGEWELKSGETPDPDGRLSRLIQRFNAGHNRPVTETEVMGSLAAYFAKTGGPGALNALYEKIYAHANVRTNCANVIAAATIHAGTYLGLNHLEELFTEEELLPRLIGDLVAKLPDEILKKYGGRNPGNENDSENFHDRKAVVARLSARLLAKPLELIRTEKSRYAFARRDHLRLGLMAAKGPAFSLYGYTAGICTADNDMLWANPAYQILPIVGSETGEPDFSGFTNLMARGYVQVFLPESSERPPFIALAVDPECELAASTDADLLFSGILEQLMTFAALRGHDTVYLPKNTWVRSNRPEIKDASTRYFRAHSIPLVSLPPVRWLEGEGEPAVLTEFYAVPVTPRNRSTVE
jgi:hypothetical protein